jgi:hypothetical protein
VTPAHLLLATLVTVVLDGVPAPSAPPPRLLGGRVLAPIALVARIADRVTVAADGGLTAQRGERACVARTIGGETGAALVELAPLARCLGATISWDAASRTLGLAFAPAEQSRAHPPFDPRAPQVAPTVIFTPQPVPTPRVLVTGSPIPRRTAIPVTPSFPLTTPRP